MTGFTITYQPGRVYVRFGEKAYRLTPEAAERLAIKIYDASRQAGGELNAHPIHRQTDR